MSGGRDFEADALVVGGGCGGVAAALALLRAGVRCVLAEPTAMLGGQLSSQGVPPDENPWVEGGGPGAPEGFVGCNATYAEFRRRVRDHYRVHERLTPAAAADDRLNPGGGWVSRLCFAPRLADGVLRRMLAEAEPSPGALATLLETSPVAADVEGDRVRAVHLEGPDGEVTVRPRLVLEATETGELLALAGVEHAIGAEGAGVHGELHARRDLPSGADHDPLDQQAITWCLAVEHDPRGEHTIDRPASYDAWRDAVPDTDPPWTGPRFSWTVPSHNEAGRVTLPLVPPPDDPAEGVLELWRYRRIVDASKHTDARADVSLLNVVQMDYWGAPILGVPEAERAAALEAARELSRCFLHWMQTEAPRHDGGAGYPGLRPSGGTLGSPDGLAMAPYIREPRRLLAVRTLTEAHLGYDHRAAEGRMAGDAPPFGAGEPFADAVAIGHYPIDLHPSCAGRNSVYVRACPFRVPLGSLVPRRVRNLIAAGKCLGVSHVANGSTRLHPVEWAAGEAAGTLAAMCVREATEPHAVVERVALRRSLQARLAGAGVPLSWPWEAGVEAPA
jgi:hypothetical protein